MQNDRIETYGHSVIQHGKFNDRIYLMKFSLGDFPGILDRIDRLAGEFAYSKIFTKIPETVLPAFLLRGFEIEAYIPAYYKNGSDAVFASRFVQPNRKQVESGALESLINSLQQVNPVKSGFSLKRNFTFRALAPSDAEKLAGLYKVVFESYPFPIHDPEYLVDTMHSNFRYFGIFDENSGLVAASSAEMDLENMAVEMTDFAVDPESRGNGLALGLLGKMEDNMARQGMKTFFTIARLNSPAMNSTFLKNGYRYSGTLVRNTNISGQIESMNVLYKKSTESESKRTM